MYKKVNVFNCSKSKCKETKRNGAILVHGSINEFFEWLKTNNYVIAKIN